MHRDPAPVGLSALRPPRRRLWSAAFFFLPLPWSVSLFSAACAAAACGVPLPRGARVRRRSPLPSAGAAWLFAFGAELLGRGQRPARLRAERALPRRCALSSRCGGGATGARPRPGRWRPSSAASARRITSRWASSAVAIGIFVVASTTRRSSAADAGRRVRASRRRRAPALPLPAAARARASAARLGRTPVDAGRVRRRRPALRRSGERAWIRGAGRSRSDRSADYGAQPRHRVGLARSRARRASRSPPHAGAAGRSCCRSLVMAANLAAMALHGSRSDLFIWHRYYVPSYLALALLAAWGWQTLSATRRPPRSCARSPAPGAARPPRRGLAAARPQPLRDRRGLLAHAARDSPARARS